MAHKLASLSILFVFLLLAFSQVLGEHQGSKEADVNQFNDDKHYYGHGHGGYGHGQAVVDTDAVTTAATGAARQQNMPSL